MTFTTKIAQPSTKTSSAPTTNAQPPIPYSSALAINGLALGRIGLGLAAILAPTITFALFKFPIPAGMSLLPRMFGGREIGLGALLWTAEDKQAADGGRRELKRAMWINAGVDAIDFASVGYGVATKTIGRLPGGLFAGGALMCLAMDAWGLRGL